MSDNGQTSHEEFAVIFDMDGVIVDNNWAHKEAIQRFFSDHGVDLTDREFRERVFGRTNREWIRETFDQELPQDQIQRMIREKEALYREIYQPHIALLGGLRKLLESLEKVEVPLALATSAPMSNVEFILGEGDIDGYFQVILTDADVTEGKPHPEIYLKTADALGTPPEQCIVIEDSLAGVEAGKAAGASVIAVTTTHSREELSHANLVVEDFRELAIPVLRGLIN